MLRDYSELIIHSFNKNGRVRYQESSKNTINNNNNNDNKQYEISKQIESINLARLSRFSFTLTPNYTLPLARMSKTIFTEVVVMLTKLLNI